MVKEKSFLGTLYLTKTFCIGAGRRSESLAETEEKEHKDKVRAQKVKLSNEAFMVNLHEQL